MGDIESRIAKMEIPVIDFGDLRGENRSIAMKVLHEACENWGFFMVENHPVDVDLMEKTKGIINEYYEKNMKESFYSSDVVKCLHEEGGGSDVDWESSFFICHRPSSNINTFSGLSENSRKTIDAYIEQVMELAENLSKFMCENLGLEKEHIMSAFYGSGGPSLGTKVAKYPECRRPDLVRGLREHTDAGGIIMLLQDDEVSGLEFMKGGAWVKIPPSKKNMIFVNTGDQIEVLSNGRYKSALHRVMARAEGSRLSIATFYNPSGDAVISPAQKLLYPNHFRFHDYLQVYATTKFSDKAPRFQTMKDIIMLDKNGGVAV